MSRRAIIFAGLGLAVFVGAVFLLEPAPRTVLRKAQRKLATERTMRVDVDAALALPTQDFGGTIVPSATSVDIVMRVDLDRTDPTALASVSTFTFTQSDGEGLKKLSGEARRKEGRHYLKLQETADLPEDIAKRALGTWVASDRPFAEFIVPPDERALVERALDAEGHAAMAQAFSSVDLFTVTAKKGTEMVGDVVARRYAVDVNLEAVSGLLLKLRELRTGNPIAAEDVLAVTALIVRWGAPSGDIWIDKRTGKFLKIGLISSVATGEASGAAGGTIVFSRYGEPVVVDVPEAKDLEKVLGPMFAKRLSLASGREISSAVEPAPSAEKTSALLGSAAQEADTDGDGLRDGEENFYGSDAWNPDTDGDGWNDGLETGKGMNPTGPGVLFGFGL